MLKLIVSGQRAPGALSPGQPGRFYYRMRSHRLRPGTRRAMTETDYAALITTAHRYLDAPVIVIWDYVARNIIPDIRAIIAHFRSDMRR
jgi:hypothetical protein